MAARSTLSRAERRKLHSNLATLRRNGWTVGQIAQALDLSASALHQLMQSKDRGTSAERAMKLENIASSRSAPPLRAGRGARAASIANAAASNGDGTNRKRRGRSTGKRAHTGATGSAARGSSSAARPRGLTADMLSEREAKQFVRGVRAAQANGLRLSEVARTLGYSNPSSFSAALKRVRIPRDVAERYAAFVSARERAPERESIESQARPAGEDTTTTERDASERDATTGTSAAVYAEHVVPLPTVSGPADVERRRRFVEQVNEASEHLSRAHASLQSTIDSGAATLVTAPGVERIMDMLRHLREELSAT
jgi:AraC-like DNA-binding protein